LYFSFMEKYLNKIEYKAGIQLAEEIGAMLWKEINNLEKSKEK